MADWPFSSVTEPNINTGLIDVPTSSTQISAGAGRLVFAGVTNVSAAPVKIRINNTAGKFIVKDVDIIPNGLPVDLQVLMRTYDGLHWNQVGGSAGDLQGEVQAYEA